MKFEAISIRNLGPFTQRDVDFHALPGPLIAVCGRNGAGKSTFLELLLGALWRECPTRGSLIDLATDRAASVTVSLEHGGRHYTVKQLADSVTRKGEAFIAGEDGAPLVGSTKVSAVDEYIEQHFPPLDVLLVSTFASQQSQGFIDAKPGDRKALLLRILGIERLEELATAAGKQATRADRELTELRGQLKQELERKPPERREAERVLTEQRAAVELTESRRSDARARRAAAEASHAETARATEAQAAYFRARNALEDEAKAHTTKILDVELRLGNNRALTERGPAITAAVKRDSELQVQAEQLNTELAGIEHAVRELRSGIGLQETKRRDVERRRGEYARTASKRPAVDAAKREVMALAAEVSRLESAVTAKRAELDDVSRTATGNRISGLRIGLAAIRDSHSHIDAARETAGKTIKQDDAAVEAASLSPGLALELNELEMELRSARAFLRKAELTAADDGAVATAEAELARCAAELGAIVGAVERDTAEVSRLSGDRDRATQRIHGVRVERAELDKLCKLEPALRVAAARIEELERQWADLAATTHEHERKRAELGEPPPPPVAVNVGCARLAETEADVDHHNAIRQVANAEAALQQATAAAERIAALEEKIRGATAHHSDWLLLSKELGKDGLQATLIDAALPELQALTNSLLHQNFGPRFTVEVRSQAADSKGKRLLETLDVVVLDSQSGREAPVETYSGGERAIIGEGLSLALTTLASRESGLTGATLIRDEAGAALDAANGRAWIAMLRQAAGVMGADRLLFVSHSPELADLADSRIDL